MRRSLTQEEFLAKARKKEINKTKIFGKYKTAHEKIDITCSCGTKYQQLPHSIYKGHEGCPNCQKKRPPLSQKEFLQKAYKHSQNSKNKYSTYINERTKVDVECTLHNTHYSQLPSSIYKGCEGCKECQFLDQQKARLLKQERTKTPPKKKIQKKPRYQIDDNKWINREGDELVVQEIIDEKHIWVNFVKTGKRKCTSERALKVGACLDPSAFIGLTKKTNCGLLMTIIDAESAQNVTVKFEDGVKVYNILKSNFDKGEVAHPKYSYNGTSKPELTVFHFIKKYFPDAINGYTAPWLRKQELDIFIPTLNIGIEYDGMAWHKNDTAKFRDEKKYKKCKQNNTKLIRIKEFSVKNKQNKTDASCDHLVPVEVSCGNRLSIDSLVNAINHILQILKVEATINSKECEQEYTKCNNGQYSGTPVVIINPDGSEDIFISKQELYNIRKINTDTINKMLTQEHAVMRGPNKGCTARYATEEDILKYKTQPQVIDSQKYGRKMRKVKVTILSSLEESFFNCIAEASRFYSDSDSGIYKRLNNSPTGSAIVKGKRYEYIT